MSRADVPEEHRRDFCLYVDEFQNFSTDSFADILSQARKYHLNLIVANQFTTQLSEEIRDAVFGNVGAVVTFRVGTTDAEFLAKQFAPVFDIDDLQFLPNYNTAVRMMIGGVPVQPFSMAILPPLGSPNPQLADALKQLSAAKYGRPKSQVESEISKRLETKALPRFDRPPAGPTSPFGPGGFDPSRLPPSSSFPSQRTSLPPLPPASGSSFLDEWLAKRKEGPAGPVISAPSPKREERQNVPARQPVPAAKPQLEASVEKTQIDADGGEFKIDRESNDSQESQVVHIDKEGNLRYGN